MMHYRLILFKAAVSITFATLGLTLILIATIPSATTAQVVALTADQAVKTAPSPLPSSPLPSGPLAPITLQLRWLDQFQFAGYYAAKKKGFYRDAGFDVTIVAGMPGLQPINEVLNGRAQYGISNGEVLLHRLNGQPLVALAAIFQHSALMLLARKDSGIRTPHDLRGRNVMSSGDAEIIAMLLAEGTDPHEVDFQQSSYNFNDLVAGKTDTYTAYLTNEPFFMKQLGIPYVTLKPNTYGIDFYSDILFTTEKEIKDHPEQVKKFREASLRGWEYALQNPDEIIDIIRNDYGSPKSVEHLRFEAEATRDLVQSDSTEIGHMNPGRWRHMANTFVKQGMIYPDYSLKGFIYDPDIPTNLMVFIGDKGFAPYEFSRNEKTIGASVDLMNAIGRVLERPVEVRLYQWAEAQARFNRGEGHALTLMAINEKRQKLYDFTQSTFSLEVTLFVNGQNIDQFDVSDLTGKRIAVKRGGFPQSIIEKRNPEAELVVVENIEEGFQLLMAGEIDAAAEEKQVGYHWLQQNKIQGIDPIEPSLSKRTFHIPVQKGNAVLLEELNRAISVLKSEGQIQEISRRWLRGPVFFITRSEKDAALIGAAVTLIIVLLLAYFLRLNIQKRSAERKKSEEKVRAFVEHSKEGVITFNARGKIDTINPATESMFGFSAVDVIGKNISLLMSRQGLLTADGYISDGLTSGSDNLTRGEGNFVDSGRELIGKRSDGTIFPIRVSISKYTLGRDLSFAGIIQDLTMQKQQQEELIQLKKIESLGSLTAGIAHNLNNFLLPIQMCSSLLKEKFTSGSIEYELSTRIIQASERSSKLVDHLMSYARQKESQKKRQPISPVINEALSILKDTIPSSVSLYTGIGNDTGDVLMDNEQIQTIVMNLVSNAVDALQGNTGAVKITLSQKPPDQGGQNGSQKLDQSSGQNLQLYVCLSIADTGSGMNEKIMERMFDPFYTTKKVGQGTGLGLSTVFGIVTDHQGTIHCSSDVGVGTTFEVYLPLAA